MNHNDIAIATGGISAPLWLPALNEWVALAVGLLSAVYLIIKLVRTFK